MNGEVLACSVLLSVIKAVNEVWDLESRSIGDGSSIPQSETSSNSIKVHGDDGEKDSSRLTWPTTSDLHAVTLSVKGFPSDDIVVGTLEFEGGSDGLIRWRCLNQ